MSALILLSWNWFWCAAFTMAFSVGLVVFRVKVSTASSRRAQQLPTTPVGLDDDDLESGGVPGGPLPMLRVPAIDQDPPLPEARSTASSETSTRPSSGYS